MSATIIPFAGFFTGRAGIHKQSKRNAPVAWARLTLLFLLGLPSPTIAQTGQYGDFTWSQSWTNITITGYTGSGGAVTIPDKINNLPVTSIGTGAFIICFGLTSVTIPNGVANIGDRAFYYCTNLASVTIPNSVTNIGSKAFYACSSLYAVTMTNSVVSIGDEAFSYSGLSTVKIPISVTNIGINPFAFCSHLIRLTVDSNNPAYASPSGVLFDKSMTTLIAYPPARYPPMDFTTAKSFEVSNGVVRICIEAFYGCSRLTNIAISPTVTNIGANPFAGCSGLIGFTVDSGNPAYCSVDGVLFDKSQSTLIAYTPSASATSYAAPDSVARIEEMAFYTSAKLASVIIPNGVSSIERSVFQGCPSLTNVVIGNGVASIGTNAFASCSNLPSIAIPNSVASIRSFAFGNCSKLTNVVIGNSVTNIESSAFDHCVKLASVVFKGNAPAVQTDTSVFNGDTTATIYYSAGMQGWWGSLFDGRPTALGFPYIYTNNSGAITITGYTDTGNAAVIPNQIDGLPVVGIASNAFTNCSLLPSVTIPASVASICANPFAQCSRATAITVDPGNSSYASVAGVLFDKNLTTLIAYPAARASFSLRIGLRLLTARHIARAVRQRPR